MMKIERNPFDFERVINTIARLFEEQCSKKNITFQLVMREPWEKVVVGDPQRLVQVLINLISNAFENTPKDGEIRLEISQNMIQEEEKTVYITFQIEDTREEVSEELLRSVEPPFFCGTSSSNLMVAGQLVALMEGAVVVKKKTKPSNGICFKVYLPFERILVKPRVNEEAMHHLQVLLLDDDEDTREYTRILLNRIGVRPLEAECTSQAMAFLSMESLRRKQETTVNASKQEPWICLIEGKKGGIDSLSATREIRKKFTSEQVEILVLAYGEYGKEEILASGAELYLNNPIFESTLVDAFTELTKGNLICKHGDPKEFDFTGNRILLIEDHMLNSEITVELLKMVHLQVEAVSNGEAGIKKFEEAKPGTYQGILLDVMMPGIDGYETCKRIRESAHPQGATIPILAMTANTLARDVNKALSAGMDGHMAKPLDTQILYTKLEKIFK